MRSTTIASANTSATAIGYMPIPPLSKALNMLSIATRPPGYGRHARVWGNPFYALARDSLVNAVARSRKPSQRGHLHTFAHPPCGGSRSPLRMVLMAGRGPNGPGAPAVVPSRPPRMAVQTAFAPYRLPPGALPEEASKLAAAAAAEPLVVRPDEPLPGSLG